MLSDLHRPRSKAALLAAARRAARISRGRAAFVRDERVLPLGVPLGCAVAVLRYRRRRDAGEERGTAAGAAAAALVGAVALTAGAALVEWTLLVAHHRDT